MFNFILDFYWKHFFKLLGLLFIYLLYISALNSNDCIEYVNKIIVHVGGCDQYGDCGVTYNDDTTGHSRRPSINQKVKICIKHKSFQWL